ncbi:hypothetical protein MML48_9g00001200 [Holotrichia oblita]|uniref:Uncharacterized protein n=1 Tax=Holotrichia oblita TaxID=644536 RepID=A0ACB9SQF0_HOLOL|nr:hypothetical protein MML48_9g00001200 [Holotrichia oblita]
MNTSVEDLLNEWNLGQFYPIFQEEGITEESFPLIDQETIDILFKKSGPKLLFKKKFEEFKNNLPDSNQEGASTTSTSTVSNSDDSLSDINFIPDDEIKKMINDFKVPQVPCVSKNNNELKRRRVENSLFTGGLEQLIQSEPEGKLILYNKNKLNNTLRQHICKIVVNELIKLNLQNSHFELKAKTFLQAAEEITKVFPGEKVESYYIPYTSPKSGLRQPARGKLWSRYVNVRAALRLTNENTIHHRTNINEDVEVPEEKEEALILLKNGIETPHNVLQLWEETYAIRKIKYKKSTLEEIFRDFPCLNTQNGLNLLESDFNEDYPNRSEIIYVTWQKVAHAIILELKNRNIQIPDSDISSSTQALLLLPTLFSPITIKRDAKNGNWRPTRTEVQESFFINFKSYAELKELVERRRKKLQTYGLPLQPFGAVVGEINAAEEFYVIINDNSYKVDSLIRCFELLFKSIHALNLEYPPESKHVWYFVQEENDISQLNNYVTEFENLFMGVHSEYQRLNFLEKSDCFIKPMQFTIGEQLSNVRMGVNKTKLHVGQVIPIHSVLKKFLELPNVLSEILTYTTNLKSESTIQNIVQTKFWNNKVKECKSNDIVFPLFLYFDEYETGNVLGSHSTIHKMGAVYISLPCIPIVYQSKLENIFLALLFHSRDLKKFGSNMIFSKLVDELNKLFDEGIIVKHLNGTLKIRFLLALVLGDNLGLNTIMGFVESFRANSYCRFCKCRRNETEQLTTENQQLRRDKTNYKNDLKLANPSATGIKEECILNQVRLFHATENFCVDIAHDIFEGIALFDFQELLYQFIIVDKFFTIDILNYQLKYFDYGKQNINKPPLLTLDNVKKKKFNMSCAELKSLALYAGLMFAQFVPRSNPHWDIYITLRKILEIILCTTSDSNTSKTLEVLIIRHHTLYLNLFNNHLKPKHHNLTHYPEIINKVGPIIHLSTLRYESKHRESKLYGNSLASRVNVSRSLAIKHQLKVCNRFINNKGFKNNTEVMQNSTSTQSILSIIPDFENICLTSDVTYQAFKEVSLSKCVTITNI